MSSYDELSKIKLGEIQEGSPLLGNVCKESTVMVCTSIKNGRKVFAVSYFGIHLGNLDIDVNSAQEDVICRLI